MADDAGFGTLLQRGGEPTTRSISPAVVIATRSTSPPAASAVAVVRLTWPRVRRPLAVVSQIVQDDGISRGSNRGDRLHARTRAW